MLYGETQPEAREQESSVDVSPVNEAVLWKHRGRESRFGVKISNTEEKEMKYSCYPLQNNVFNELNSFFFLTVKSKYLGGQLIYFKISVIVANKVLNFPYYVK